MRGVNKAILVGRLGADPEMRYTSTKDPVTTMRVATSEYWSDRESGEKHERTEWHNVVAFGRLAEICGEYLLKASAVFIEGSIRTRKWQDKEGRDRYSTEIIASEVQFLDRRQDQSD